MPEPTTIAAAADSATPIWGFSISTFVFGSIGSLISWRWAPQLGFVAKVTGMMSAGGLAMFGTPILKQISGVTDQSYLFGAAGLIGVFGLSITASIFDVIKDTKWGRIIESRLGKNTDSGS